MANDDSWRSKIESIDFERWCQNFWLKLAGLRISNGGWWFMKIPNRAYWFWMMTSELLAKISRY